MKIRLGAPNYPGDTMTLTGSVSAKDDGANTVDASGLVGANVARRPRDGHGRGWMLP